MSNLTQRILVALIGIPLVIFIVMSKPTAFFGLILILAGIGAHEYYGFAKAKSYIPQTSVGVALSVLIAMTFGKFRLNALLSNINISIISLNIESLTVILILGLLTIFTIELFRGYTNPIENIATTFFGALYCGICIGSVYGIYEYFSIKNIGVDNFSYFNPGLFVVAILASIWLCDSAAYFAGRAFGKHKLLERVSPGKTWEGAIAGFIICVAVWIAAPKIFYSLSVIPMVHFIVFGIIAGSVGQIGDLCKSILKRDAKVKDSSNLIPGHGGVIDRLDSLMFVCPVILLYLEIVGI